MMERKYMWIRMLNVIILKIELMKLHEIIQTNDELDKAILTEELFKYRRSLLTYYKTYFTSEPMLMVVSVTNACQYALIVPSDEFYEALESYLGHWPDTEENELISSQSIRFSDF